MQAQKLESLLSQLVESYRFWDIVTLWSQERLEHEELVARALAAGVIRDGLIIQSQDLRWMNARSGQQELKGYPYVGYCAEAGHPMIVLRADALEHLLGVVNRAARPDRSRLREEFITRNDFRSWLEKTSEPLPHFWFPVS